MSDDRNSEPGRTLLEAISVLTGVKVAGPSTGLAEEEARRIVSGRFETLQIGDANTALEAKEIVALVSGKSIFGVDYDGDPYVIAFAADGRGTLNMAGRAPDAGRWWVDPDADTISSQWETVGGGREIICQYYRTDVPGLYKSGWSESGRWSVFFAVSGTAEGAN